MKKMAGGVGFEPTGRLTLSDGFQDRCNKPLCPGWVRTSDHPVDSRTLFQLSYWRKREDRLAEKMVDRVGLEPTTPCLQNRRSPN